MLASGQGEEKQAAQKTKRKEGLEKRFFSYCFLKKKKKKRKTRIAVISSKPGYA